MWKFTKSGYKGGDEDLLIGNKKVPVDFIGSIDGYLSTFEELLGLRAMVGYGFEGDIETAQLHDKAALLPVKCSGIVNKCRGVARPFEKVR